MPNLRPTRRSDLASLAAIAEATELFPGALLDGMAAGFLDGTTEDVWLTAEVDGQPAGFLFCQPEALTAGTWNLRAIGVAPALQGRGIGCALMRRLEQELREAGHRILVADTSGTAAYARTRAFYLANGYAEEARIRDFWESGADKVIFWKRL